MDARTVTEMLRLTLAMDPAQRLPAEEQLKQVKHTTPCASSEQCFVDFCVRLPFICFDSASISDAIFCR